MQQSSGNRQIKEKSPCSVHCMDTAEQIFMHICYFEKRMEKFVEMSNNLSTNDDHYAIN